MMCDICLKNPATTHIKKVVNGVAKEKHLCSYCAAKEGYSNFGNLSFANMLASVFSENHSNNLIATRRCECCGASFSDIAQSGKVGCSECYEVFKEQLLPSLGRLHGKTVHVGKVPNEQEVTENVSDKIEILRKSLNEAIKNEEFEKAAELRDEIKALEGEASKNE